MRRPFLDLKKPAAAIEIWNVLGQSFGLFDTEAGVIDVRDLPAGVYLLRVHLEDQHTESLRFVKF